MSEENVSVLASSIDSSYASNNTVAIYIRLRRKTTADWKNSTYIPLQGEPCAELCTDGKIKFKIGDGTNKWSNLPYANVGDVKVAGTSIIDNTGIADIPAASATVNGVVTIGDQTISGVKTFSAPTDVNKTESTTMKLMTSNGGSIRFGKEGANSGSMIRLDQVDGTCRLRFYASATAGAMVWEQPESNSGLYLDVNNVFFKKTSAVQFENFKSAGYLYTDSSGYLQKGTMPTALKNPNALTFGSRTYDGSSAQTITASDIGADVTVTQKLTNGEEIGSIKVGSTTTKLYAPSRSSITIDSELSNTSTNPVQNKVIKSALDGKLSLSGGDIYGSITPQSSGSYNLGDDSHRFNGVYSNNFYENGTALSNKYLSNDGTSWLTYTENSGTMTCTGLSSTATDTDIRIASYVNGKVVTGIGNGAFQNRNKLTSVVIPNNVTSIGNSAFSGCSSLTSVEIPDSVTSIGKQAFALCPGLTNVTIGNGALSIGDSAFSYCMGLTNLVIGNGTKSIGQSAFNLCTSLTSITIPNSVTLIQSSAFSDCRGLESVTIPDSVTEIRRVIFNKCSNLTSIKYLGTIKAFKKMFTNTQYHENGYGENTLGNNIPDTLVIYCTDGQIAKDGTVILYYVNPTIIRRWN